VSHGGLRRFIAKNDATGLPSANVEKIRNIVTFLQEMATINELSDIPNWKAHQLKGNRKGPWSLTVSRNWRITFATDEQNEIFDLNFED
jgi:toxin HigB-1